MKDLQAWFDAHEPEYLKFKNVENKLSKRPHLHAFLLLDSVLPGTGPLVTTSYRDEVCLAFSLEKLAKSAITEEQVRDLVRCGIQLTDGRLSIVV